MKNKEELNLKNKNYVFHGTYTYFSKIDLKKCKPWKDFGQGFYVTKNFTQAKKFAKKKFKEVQRSESKIKDIAPYVLVFEQTNMNVDIYKFDSKNAENMRLWFKTIFAYRNDYLEFISEDILSKDVIEGKIADDGTREILNNFDIEDLNDHYIMDKNIKRCLPDKLSTQLCYKTQKAVNTLKFVGAYNVKEERWL